MLGHAPLSQFPLSTLAAALAADTRIGAAAFDDASLWDAVALDGALQDSLEHAQILEIYSDAVVEELFAWTPDDSLPGVAIPTLSLGGAGVVAPKPKRAKVGRATYMWPEPEPWPSKPFIRERETKRVPQRKPKLLKPNDPESQRELELLLAIALGLESED